MNEFFVIEGGHPLQGEIHVTGNKNAALPMLAASLLTDEPVTLHNVPRIGDVNTMMALLQHLGVEVIRNGGSSITLQARDLRSHELDRTLSTQIRASILLAGPLLARSGQGQPAMRQRVQVLGREFGQFGQKLLPFGDAELIKTGKA